MGLLPQVHYQIVRPDGDHTGVRLELTAEPQPFSAGMFTYASGFVVPPQQPAFHVPATCCYSGWEQIKAFAFRVHAHSLGRCATASSWGNYIPNSAPTCRGKA